MKKICILTVFIIALSLVSCGITDGTENSSEQSQISSVQSADIEAELNYEYEENADGEITITKYIGTEYDITVPGEINGKPVTTIGFKAFYDNREYVHTVVLPDSLDKLDTSAFLECKNLKSVTFGKNIRAVCASAFALCSSLTKIDLSADTVEFIGAAAFEDCISLKVISLGKNVHTIYENAFHGCVSLENINMPDSLSEIGSKAFANCASLKEITIPKSINKIGDEAFIDCGSLTNVTFQEGVERIDGFGVFADCASIQTMTIPESVKYISETTFALPNLQTIIFLGDCPEFGTNEGSITKFIPDIVKIYCNKDNSGWSESILNEKFELLQLEQ